MLFFCAHIWKTKNHSIRNSESNQLCVWKINKQNEQKWQILIQILYRCILTIGLCFKIHAKIWKLHSIWKCRLNKWYRKKNNWSGWSFSYRKLIECKIENELNASENAQANIQFKRTEFQSMNSLKLRKHFSWRKKNLCKVYSRERMEYKKKINAIKIDFANKLEQKIKLMPLFIVSFDNSITVNVTAVVQWFSIQIKSH